MVEEGYIEKKLVTKFYSILFRRKNIFRNEICDIYIFLFEKVFSLN